MRSLPLLLPRLPLVALLAPLVLGGCPRRDKPPPVEKLWFEGGTACGRLVGGELRCQGKGDQGRPGSGGSVRTSSPPPDLGPVAEIAQGRAHGCARLPNGTVACWGDNSGSQLATGDTSARASPALVQGLIGVVSLVASGDGTCALLSDRTVRCWGDNAGGRLSTRHGPLLNVPTPVHF